MMYTIGAGSRYWIATLGKRAATHIQQKRETTMRKFAVIFTSLFALFMVTACEKDADIASRNLSLAADMFEINRRVVFYNGITGEYILVVEGRCSLGNFDSRGRLSVTCKTGENAYKKHYLGLSDNVTYFAEQIKALNVSVYHYRVIFKPQSILPDIEARGSLSG